MGVGRSWTDYFTIYALDLHQYDAWYGVIPEGRSPFHPMIGTDYSVEGQTKKPRKPPKKY